MDAESATVTLAQVARRAGVSSACASLALNDRPGVAAETRLRVLAAARALDYRMRPVHRNRVIGVVSTDLANPYHTDVLAGLEEEAQQLGTRVVVAHGRRDAGHLEAQLDTVLDLGVDAVVAVTTWLSPAVLERTGRMVPTVVIGRMQDAVTGTDTVRNDDELGAALAVRHLVDRGHRAIAHVTASSRPGPASRRHGFLRAVERAGMLEASLVIGPDRTEEGVDLLLRRRMHGDPAAPTAVFCANDITAVRVLHRAAAVGLSIPDDLSVVGYDSSSVAMTVRPLLTSVNQPRQGMGRLAVRMVHERFRGRTHDALSVLEPTLTIRRSTGPAPSVRSMGPRM